MAASPSSDRYRYHVFLSFRGEDTRKGFTNHLYIALKLAGIHTFRDDDEIERGAEIAVELQKAIRESYVSVIVFSADYASSRWCLDELSKIMKRQRDDGHVVVPVFYKVDPSDVRKQTNTFGEAFAKHEKRFKEEIGKVEEWRRSLIDAANLGGKVLGEQYESELIQDIVEEIAQKLDKRKPRVAPRVIGIDDRVKDINKWIRDGSTDVGVAGIYGMGGIGKTTIAKAAYNMNWNYFEGRSFLADVRATSKHPNGLVRLQMQLLTDIQKQKPMEIYNVDEGNRQIERVIGLTKILLVLDDVDDSDQFSAILEMQESFCPGSKIIITTRNQHLLMSNGISERFRVWELQEAESIELFSWHAFGQAHPVENLMELSRTAVRRCGGLPLAIKVLGSSLFGLDVDLWKEAIAKLDVGPDIKVQEVLRVSFDGKHGTRLDDHDQSLFLHIACFFTGRKKDFTITVLSSLDFCTNIGIKNLVDRCFLQIDGGRLIVHQLLIDMAREVVREESKDPGRRSRVWQKDASDILEDKSGTKTIKALMLNLITQENTLPKTTHQPGYFSWISNYFSSTELNSYRANFKTDAFEGMHNLQLLLLYNVNFSGACDAYPKKLLWLSWQGLLWESIPKEFPLQNLVVLELQTTKLKFLWEGTKKLPKLKILDLSHSCCLVTTSDLSGLSSLEKLILKGCTIISEIDESIGELEKLVFLDVTDCKSLEKLPETIDRLTSLQGLNLSGCSNLTLRACTTTDSNNLSRLLSIKSWQSIWSQVSPSRSVEATAFSLVHLPQSLVHLNLSYCNLSEIFSDFSIFPSLKKLELSGNTFASLPGNLKSHTALQHLNLFGCTNLIVMPEVPPSVDFLYVGECTSMKIYSPDKFTSRFHGCRELVEVVKRFRMKPLISELDVEMVRNMGMYNLEHFALTDELEMFNCLSHTIRTFPLQGLYECGIFSMFLHGNMIPDWYKYRGETNVSIIVPSHPELKITGLNICVVYAISGGGKEGVCSSPILKVSNEEKGAMWAYCPVSVGLPKVNENISWLSHWQFEEHELEYGEELRISVDTTYMGMPISVKQLAVHLVYEQNDEHEGNACNGEQLSDHVEESNLHEAPYWSPGVLIGHVSAPKYQIWPGTYFLYNHYNGGFVIPVEKPTENMQLFEHERWRNGKLLW